MRRRVLVRRPLSIDLPSADAVFTADPGIWLPGPARPRGPGSWTVGLGAGPATRSVACRIGGVWRTGHGTWRSVRWEPESEPEDLVPVPAALPKLHGELGLVVRGRGPSLVLRGFYRPPGGWVGALVDAAALRRIAVATARRFIDDIGERVQDCSRVGPAAG